MGHALLPSDADADVLVSSGIWHVDDPARLAVLRRRHRGVTFAAGLGVPGRVLANGTPEHIDDVLLLSPDDADRVRCSLVDEEHMCAVAGFPIVVGNEVCGVLEFFSETPFATDQMLLDVMAQVGMVLGRIVERTRYEGALLRAREVAEVASAAKTEFLSRMSHELRTPLTAVLGYAELLAMAPLGEEERGYVAAIEKGGIHLLALINDVLDVSRLEKGELRLSVEPVDVAAAIVDVVALMRPLAAAHDVTIRAGLPRRFARDRAGRQPGAAPGDAQPRRQRHQVQPRGRHGGHRDRRRQRRVRSGSTSATPAGASPPPTSSRSSPPSSASGWHAPWRAPASGWASRASSSTPWEAR